ncbi:MAG: hypothetical protein ACE5GU_10235 [Candidatus Scalinduaceae bacterium]
MVSHDEIKNDTLEMINHTKEMLEMICKGFRTHNLESLKDIEGIGMKLHKESIDLTKSLLEEKSEEGIKHFIPIPGHLDKIGDGLDRLFNSVKKKIREDVLFSDKSVSEAYKLFEEIQELLTCLSDCITTCNRVLAEHIDSNGKKLCELADEYAIFHEDRLISGVCMPKSAPIYLDILDSFKSVIWHIREITRNILTRCSESGEEHSRDQ